MSEMIERVAKALCDDTLSRWRTPIALQKEPWREFIPAARAAIEAMRVPGAWMIDEMCGEWARNPSDQRLLGEQMLAYWRAAINAALVDDPGNPETQAMIDVALQELGP